MAASDFDAEFERRLLKTICNKRPPEDLCRAIGDDHKTHWISSQPTRRRLYKWNRLLLSWLADFCRIDLMAGPDRGNTGRSGQARRKVWPRCLLAVHVLCTIALTETLYRQYMYDSRLIRLERLRAQLGETGPGPASLGLVRALQEAERSFEATRHVAHFRWPIVSQCVILIYSLAASACIVATPIYLKRAQVALPVFRSILEPLEESRIWARLVLAELRRLSRSSCAFIRARHLQVDEDLALFDVATIGGRGAQTEMRKNPALQARRRVLVQLAEQLVKRHQALVGHLQAIALAGRLNPLNRSAACRERLATGSLCMMLISLMAALVFLIVATIFMSDSLNSGKLFPINELRDLTDVSALVCMMLVSSIAASLTIPMLNLTLYDQHVHLARCRALIRHQIRVNELRLIEPAKFGPGGGRLLDQIEADLLMVIIQWRLSSSSFSSARKCVNYVGLLMIFSAILVPLICSLHSAYLHENDRKINTLISLASGAVCLFNVTSLALVHQHYARTFRLLWSLAALLSRYESIPLVGRGRLATSSSLAMLTLRRELSDPRKTIDRFAYRFLAMPITYRNLIKVFVWLSVVQGALLDESNQLLPGSWLSDPLGLIGPTAASRLK